MYRDLGHGRTLQFHLLPIRDWNEEYLQKGTIFDDCNFIYSLLGIETALIRFLRINTSAEIAISFTPY